MKFLILIKYKKGTLLSDLASDSKGLILRNNLTNQVTNS